MITLYVPLEAKGDARKAIASGLSETEGGLDSWAITKNSTYPMSGDQSLNELSANDIDVIATSAPTACGVGYIAPSRIRETVLVVILGASLKVFHELLPKAIARNRPNRVLALVKDWGNDIHETQLRAYLQAKDGITLTVEHLDR